jgi:hypothetical protein
MIGQFYLSTIPYQMYNRQLILYDRFKLNVLIKSSISMLAHKVYNKIWRNA